MTEFIAHRINTIKELKELPEEYGVEIDLRDSGDKLILVHDPFSNGEDFEQYLKVYHHGTMILNIKSERIEHKVLELLKKYKIEKYFFLDSSIPMMVLLSSQGENNCAIRFSEFEPIEGALAMKNRTKWVWVDCFNRLPINSQNYKELRDAGFKLCLVSPELQGRSEDITAYKDYLAKEEIIFDAICTKNYNIPKWQ